MVESESSGLPHTERLEDLYLKALREKIRKIKELEQRVKKLEEVNRSLEMEKKLMERQRLKLEREVRSLRKEIEKMNAPPLITGTLIELLPDGRAVVKSTTGPNFVVRVSSKVKRESLSPGCMVAMNQRSYAIVEVLPSSKDPVVMNMEIEERPRVTYNDIGGLKEQIEEIRETVELPLLRPDLFEKVGIEPPKGVLLYGPPGCGKTLLAKAVASQTKATFIRVIASEFVRKYIGEGARLVREVFQLAREKSPSIIFIDEIDAIAAKRLDDSTSGDREVHRTLMQLLSEMDGFDPRGDVRIIGATNRPDILDPAILRPGRFDRLIEIPLPNEEGRYEIFKIHTRRMNLSDEVSLRELAKLTDGATGADIRQICIEAGMFAIKEGRDYVSNRDFLLGIGKVLRKELGAKTQEGMYF